MESLCALPLLRESRSFGALFFMSVVRDAYREIPVALLERVASAVAVAVDNCFAYEELARLRDRLANENTYLQEEIQQEHNFHEIVGKSPRLASVFSLIESVAATPSTVLILGETGTGKELIARAIHDRSERRDRALVKVNCAALPSGLIESELFGHEKGAFTGATDRRIGRFELASGGTIFLDEIGDMPAEAQVKLLRVLQEGEIERVGGSRTIRVDARVIAATNRDLAAAVAAGTFRQDLFYRLNVFPIVVPPLRERKEDLALLVHHFVARYGAKLGRRVTRVSPDLLQRLTSYSWPGNVRELENVIERAVILSQGSELQLAAVMPSAPAPVAAAPSPAVASSPGDGAEPAPPAPAKTPSLVDVQRDHILSVLRQAKWRIDGPHGAAHVLSVKPSTLRSRMKKLGIARSGEEDR
jgi:formate hydrogenlyase transcriptional activator